MMTEFIMLCGIPYSGKSSYARDMEDKGYSVFSSDAIRGKLYGDESTQGDPKEVFDLLHGLIKDSLKNGNNTIYDATNINWKRRKAFLKELSDAKIECNKICILFATPLSECISRIYMRDRVVPEDVICRMYKNFSFPCMFEGWDKIKIVWSKGEYPEYNLSDKIGILEEYDQDNSHHSFTLGEHLTRCSDRIGYLNLVSNNSYDTNLVISGLLHDIGKPEVRSFYNAKGEPTSEAHYYNHNNTSAYEAMFYLKSMGYDDYDIVDICSLVYWHMQPYFINKKKTEDKYKNMWGENFYNRIMRLHEADVYAH